MPMIKKSLYITLVFLIITVISVAWHLYFAKQKPALAAGNVYYVDPDFAGASDGSWSKPWTSLTNPAWSTINTALSTGDVTVYFSAREAASDVAEDYGDHLEVFRTDKSTYRLTLDGMSKYNTDDAGPNWQDYGGGHKLKLIGKYSMGLGWGSGSNKQSNITMRGFEVTGDSARVLFGGDNVVVEHIYSHDTTNLGPAFHMLYATNPEASCTETIGRYSNVIIRNNLIDSTYGEALYIGGTNNCPSYGNSHGNIFIENNTIRNAGINGAQGDGIDLKDGLTNVTVRGNVISGSQNIGITSAGVYSGTQNLVIEKNKVFNGRNRGIQVAGNWGTPNGVIVRNNIVYSNSNIGISFTGSQSNIKVYSNTAYNNAGQGLGVGNVNGLISNNNLVFDNNSNGNQMTIWSSTNITSDYNLWSPISGYSSEGLNSINESDPSILAVSPSSGDFYLKSGSPAIDKGISIGSFSDDYAGISRPQGSAWDIGAYEYVEASPPPPTLKGDFNSDSKVNDLDFTVFKNAFKSIFNSLFDLNSDNAIDVKDLGVLMSGWRP